MVEGMTQRGCPAVTVALTLVTGAVSVAGLLSSDVLGALGRTPAVVHGQPWRLLTALLVQDGGVAGTASNLVFLAMIGVAVEQVAGRVAMLGCYLAAGLAGQLVGLGWQPFGAGNSVAVCGLAGLLVWRVTDRRLPHWAGSAVTLWWGALLATWWWPLFGLGVLAAAVDRHALLDRPALRMPLLGAGTLVVACVLIGLGNIHGPALAVGTVLGWIARPGYRAGPGTPDGGRA
jgi:membrane associated rhomboid family serine protease